MNPSLITKLLKTFVLASLIAAGITSLDLCLALISKSDSLFASRFLIQRLYLSALDYFISFDVAFVMILLCSSSRRLAQKAGSLLIIIFLVVYFAGWATFFTADQFPNIEAWRFFIYNNVQLLLHLWQTSKSSLVLVFLALALPLAAQPLVFHSLRTAMQSSWLRRANVLRATLLLIFFHQGIFLIGQRLWSGFLTPNHLVDTVSPQVLLTADAYAMLSIPTLPKSSNLEVTWNRQVSLKEYKSTAGTIRPAVPVIVIVIESLRSDVLSDDRYMPNLYRLKQEGLEFPQTFAVSNATDYAWPAILSSAYPMRKASHYYYPPQIPFPRVFIYDVLKEFGYATALISAQNERWGGMHHYLRTTGLDLLQDSNAQAKKTYVSRRDPFAEWVELLNMAGKLDDALVVHQAVYWINKIQKTDFFLAINLQRTHFPYTWPDSHSPAFGPVSIDFPSILCHFPANKTPVMKNRYYSALRYTDEQIGKFLSFLKSRDLYERSIIVVTGDHGEAFYERGTSGHGNDLLYEQVRTPLIIKAPYKEKRGIRPVTAQTLDVPPTICGLLGIKPHPAFQGQDLLGAAGLERRPLFINVQTARANQASIVLGGWRFIEDFDRRRQMLFNLNTDRHEHIDVLHRHPNIARALRNQLLAWRALQIQYHADKKKQKDFYPPQFKAGSL